MKRDRGEPGGFGVEEGMSLLALGSLIFGVIFVVLAVGAWAGIFGHMFDGLDHLVDGLIP